MNKLLFYVFYKTQDCTTEDHFSVQCFKAWTKENAIEEFKNLLADKSYIRVIKVTNEIEYGAILKNVTIVNVK